jgi:hypothetical protein
MRQKKRQAIYEEFFVTLSPCCNVPLWALLLIMLDGENSSELHSQHIDNSKNRNGCRVNNAYINPSYVEKRTNQRLYKTPTVSFASITPAKPRKHG